MSCSPVVRTVRNQPLAFEPIITVAHHFLYRHGLKTEFRLRNRAGVKTYAIHNARDIRGKVRRFPGEKGNPLGNPSQSRDQNGGSRLKARNAAQQGFRMVEKVQERRVGSGQKVSGAYAPLIDRRNLGFGDSLGMDE